MEGAVETYELGGAALRRRVHLEEGGGEVGGGVERDALAHRAAAACMED